MFSVLRDANIEALLLFACRSVADAFVEYDLHILWIWCMYDVLPVIIDIYDVKTRFVT